MRKPKKMKYEKALYRNPINSYNHKIFRIPELLIKIIERVTEHQTMKFITDGRIYYERESGSTKYRKITHVCKQWQAIFEKQKIVQEYEQLGQEVYFCTICDRYEIELHGDTHIHQQIWNKVMRTDAKLRQFHKIIEWTCKGNCMVHCAQKPGHCQIQEPGMYVSKTFMEF